MKIEKIPMTEVFFSDLGVEFPDIEMLLRLQKESSNNKLSKLLSQDIFNFLEIILGRGYIPKGVSDYYNVHGLLTHFYANQFLLKPGIIERIQSELKENKPNRTSILEDIKIISRSIPKLVLCMQIILKLIEKGITKKVNELELIKQSINEFISFLKQKQPDVKECVEKYVQTGGLINTGKLFNIHSEVDEKFQTLKQTTEATK